MTPFQHCQKNCPVIENKRSDFFWPFEKGKSTLWFWKDVMIALQQATFCSRYTGAFHGVSNSVQLCRYVCAFHERSRFHGNGYRSNDDTQLWQTSANAGACPTVYILRMRLIQKGLLKNKQNKTTQNTQNLPCCPLLLHNALDALVFRHKTADISEGRIKSLRSCVTYL